MAMVMGVVFSDIFLMLILFCKNKHKCWKTLAGEVTTVPKDGWKY